MTVSYTHLKDKPLQDKSPVPLSLVSGDTATRMDLLDGELNRVSVSYTHLDVYKRQPEV